MSNRLTDTPTPPNTEQTQAVSRRRVFKAAIATVPVIATLPSGAAWARSSNVVSAASEASAVDRQGRTLCFDLRTGSDYSGSSVDLGPKPFGAVTAVRERAYRREPKGSAQAVNEAEMCRTGGTFYYRDETRSDLFSSDEFAPLQSSSADGFDAGSLLKGGGWKQARVPRGMLVSATALSSFAGGIYFTEV